MPSTLTVTKPDNLLQENILLKQQLVLLQKQLDWFKQQVFGQKSERRLVEILTQQGSLFEPLAQTNLAQVPTEKIQYERKKKQKQRNDAVTDSGLRFAF